MVNEMPFNFYSCWNHCPFTINPFLCRKYAKIQLRKRLFCNE